MVNLNGSLLFDNVMVMFALLLNWLIGAWAFLSWVFRRWQLVLGFEVSSFSTTIQAT